jgi:hypothetical protein
MIGERLKHYQVEELIGRGGMGVVYRARDVRLGRSVALKVLKEEVTSDPDRKRRFLQEARSASAITHPAIAQVYDVDEVNGTLFIALEFVEGQTVGQLVGNRELDLLGAVEIAIQASDGLGKAHAVGIIHRDIKSDNLMVTPDGHVKILDFGLAKLTDPGSTDSGKGLSMMETLAQTQVGTVMGTVAYMSPEQARGKQVDHRSDIFSLGIVLYEMVVGELPFKGQSALDTMHAIAFEEVRPVTLVRKDLPPDLQRILSRCLRKRAEDRYDSIDNLVGDLKKLKTHLETGSQTAVGFRERVQDAIDWARFSVPFGVPGIAAAIIVLALVLFLIFMREDLIGTLIVLVLLGIPVYRFIRNRQVRMIRKLVSKLSKVEEVQAILVRNNLVTVIVEKAKANLFIRVNSLLEMANKKLLYGDPIEIVVRDDVEDVELRQLLREPGVRYVDEDFLQELDG